MSEKNCKEVKEEMDEIVRPGFEVGWKVRIKESFGWEDGRGKRGEVIGIHSLGSVRVAPDGDDRHWAVMFEDLECAHQWRNVSNMPIYDPRVQCCQCGEVRGPGESFEIEVEAKDPKDKPQAKLLGQALNFIIHDEFAADYDYSKLRGMESIYTLDKEKDMDRMEVEAPKTVLEKKALKEAKELAIQNATGTKKQEYFDAVNRFIGLECKAREARALADELKKSLGLTKAEIDELI